jgi:hypothetical protein
MGCGVAVRIRLRIHPDLDGMLSFSERAFGWDVELRLEVAGGLVWFFERGVDNITLVEW